MIDKMIVDADLCIKLGGSAKYRYLHDILPMVATQIYMHTHAYGEVMMPSSAVQQLNELIAEGKVVLVNEKNVEGTDKAVYDATYQNLARVMINPNRPYAKATGIPVFATDEMNLQPIIDTQLNTGLDDITCIRIVDIIEKAHQGEIAVPRKVCKALWVICGKMKETFDREIWPVE